MTRDDDQFRALVEHASDFCLFMIDEQGRIATWNASAQRVYGYSAQEMLGQPGARLYAPEAVAQGDPGRNLAVALRDGRHTVEEWRVRADGSRFWAEIVMTVLTEPEPLRIVKVTRDVTERKHNADRLAEHVRRQEALARLGHRVLASSSLNEVVEVARTTAREALAADATAVYEPMRDGSGLQLHGGGVAGLEGRSH